MLTADGVVTDPNKFLAIHDMPTPTDVKSLKRFLGMVTYLVKLLPNLSSVCEPLRRLELKDVEWCWLTVHDEAVQSIKHLVCDAPVLKFYDVNQEVTFESDASPSGLGASLLQEGQPVTFVSRALTPQNVVTLRLRSNFSPLFSLVRGSIPTCMVKMWCMLKQIMSPLKLSLRRTLALLLNVSRGCCSVYSATTLM